MGGKTQRNPERTATELEGSPEGGTGGSQRAARQGKAGDRDPAQGTYGSTAGSQKEGRTGQGERVKK